MMRMKLSVNASTFTVPLRKAIEQSAAMGAEAVQIDVRNQLRPSEISGTGIRQLRHFLAERDLKIESTIFPLRHPLSEMERLDERVAALKAALNWSHELGAEILAVRIGRIPDDSEDPGRIRLRDILNDLASHGSRVGTTLCLTTGSESPLTLGEFLQGITAGLLGLDCDPATLVMNDQNQSDWITRLHERILHVRVRDAIRDIDGIGQEVAFGEGQVNWTEFLDLLDQASYQGWYTVDRTIGERRPVDLARGMIGLRNLQNSR